MPLGSDAAERMPTDSWTELAHQTPTSQVRLSQCSNAYSLPDSCEQGMPDVTDSLSLGDLLGLNVATCRIGRKQLVVCLPRRHSQRIVTDLQALADKETDSIKSGTAWMCLLCGKRPHDIGQALWAVLLNALSHMPCHHLRYTP